jgi:hypothetical protein
MNIACLGWGSLLWKPGALLLRSPWQHDGPMLPIEFARVGDGGELATVLCEGAAEVRTWWALLCAEDLDAARAQLRQREEIDPAHPEWIGSLPSDFAGLGVPAIRQWLTTQPLDAVVWTALPPRFAGVEGASPSAEQAVAYLQSLQLGTRAHAQEYVRKVPASLDTVNRREIVRVLGWDAYP